MTRFPGFIGPSYTLRAINLDCQRCVNWYPEVDELQTGKEKEIAALIGRPGARLLLNLPAGSCRGGYTMSNGTLLVVGGNTLYQISNTWVPMAIGTLNTSAGIVFMADNGSQAIIVDGTNGYIFDMAAHQPLTVITDENFPNTTNRVAYQDGYFIVPVPDTQKFQWSNLYDGMIWDPLDFASAEGSPDNLVTLVTDHREIWLFGTRSTEVFYNAGDTQTFDRIQGTFLEYGCVSPYTPMKVNNAIIWLSTGVNGSGIVMKTSVYQAVRISNHAIEASIQSYGDISMTVAWTFTKDGHHFYALQFANANTTWVYDDSTGVWHEWTYTDPVLGQQKFMAIFHTYAYNTYVVGDYRNGNLYALDSDYYTDNGQEITAMRAAPHFSEDMVRIIHQIFQLDIETGVGLDGIQLGTDPQVTLCWSDDYGHSWSGERQLSMGAIGAFHTRVIFRRLGVARDRVYRVKITDPVKRNLVGVQIKTLKGRT